MANPGSMNTPTNATGGDAPHREQAQLATVPFTRASAESREQGNVDTSRQMTPSSQALGTFDIPANGYFDGLVVKVTATGGDHSNGSVTATEDAPFNALSNITVQEPNGSTIPFFNTGYGLALAGKYGGYWFGNDPRKSPVFSSVSATTGNFSFLCRIPIGLQRREALGALPNQDSDATFKFKADLSASTTVYSTPPNISLPTVRVQAWLESWEMPAATNGNLRNVTEPPAMNTTQFWTEVPHPVVAGTEKVRLTRMGNYIRMFIFVLRRTAGTRANGHADWPEQTILWFDKRPRDIIDKGVWEHTQYERYGYAGTPDTADGPENGVFPYDFEHDLTGRVGWGTRDGWLETISSSRVELEGTFGNAGQLTVMYNDVAVAGNVFL